jgi:isopentenyl diphosphate isomerase/L-lactate dehydrogenase-like FMN-dependent dehydrogenase
VQLEAAVNVADFEAIAREQLDDAAFGYFVGGAGDERTLRDNVEAFGRRRLRPRVLVDVSAPTTETTILGTRVSMPLLVAPVAFQRLAHPDGEPAMSRAAAAAGTIMCLSTLATATPGEVAAVAPDAPRWLQLYVYRDRGVARDLVGQAVEHGYGAIALTVDLPAIGRRERDLRTGFAAPVSDVPSLVAAGVASVFGASGTTEPLFDATLSWRDLEEIRSYSKLPLVVKGVLTAEDARFAAEHGAAAVVVSNHGGRQLDGVQATIDALAGVVEAVGDRIEVLLDGGVRRGVDVVQALALGARGVLAGRAPIWGLAAGGAAGAQRVLELLREEIELALVLCGCSSPGEVTPAHVTERY